MPYIIASVTIRDIVQDLELAIGNIQESWSQFDGPAMTRAIDSLKDLYEVLDAYATSGWTIVAKDPRQ